MRTNWKSRAFFAAGIGIACSGIGFAQIKGGDPIPKFSVTSMGGKQMFFPDLATGGPLFIYFIRDGDTVSQQTTSYINKMIRSYGKSRATWYGIVNVKADRGMSFEAEADPAFRLELDEDMSAMKAFELSNAPAIFEIGGDGTVLNAWRGFSGVNLKAINRAMAEASHKSLHNIDFSAAPSRARYGQDFHDGHGNG